MLEDHNFVKKLTSCEIMGGANNICSDKTGTLTMNQMTWMKIWAGTSMDIPDAGSTEPLNMGSFIKSEWTQTLIKEGVCCNTIGTIKDAGATELAMIKFVDRC